MRLPGPLALAFAGLCVASLASPAFAALPYVTRISTVPESACAQTTTHLVIDGLFPDGCGRVLGTEQFGAERVVVNLRPVATQDTACVTVLQPWRREFDLGQLPAGDRSVDVEIRVYSADANEPPQIFVEPFAFSVAPKCGGGTGSLPYVDQIGITPAPPCNLATVVLCRNDSIGVCVRGTFPNDCFHVVRIEQLPSPIVGPNPQPPIVRVVVDDGACVRRICQQDSFPWNAEIVLPPLPAGEYGLMVELAVVTCSEEIDPTRIFRTVRGFGVGDCGPPSTCLRGDFITDRAPGSCDARVSPTQPAELTYGVATGIPLAGLEGRFVLGPPGLHVTSIEAAGAAAGFHVSWSPDPGGGAHYVLFADTPGELIPVSTFPSLVAVLNVRLEAIPGVAIPDRTDVLGLLQLGADEHGQEVTLCPIPWDLLQGATICASAPCDFNHDGVLDVRDLVLMVNCLHGPCITLPGRGDCNGDSLFTLDDVICCATRLLRESCPECPPDTTARPEPGVGVTFGVPLFSKDGVDLPVHVTGADRIGGARLAIRYPTDRFDARTELPATNGWLHLQEVRDGQLVVGLIQTNRETVAESGSLDLTLHLSLRAGQESGGVVSVAGLDFSGRDGKRLIGDDRPGSVDLGAAPHLSLGESRPNPTTGVTRFSLALDRPGVVDVAVYDISGRRMTTLLTGWQEAGTRELFWDGRTSDGHDVPQGLYFYRGVAGGQIVSRKLVMLRGR